MVMGKIKTALESMGAAIAFAECGQWDTARELLNSYEDVAASSNRKFLVISPDKVVSDQCLEYSINLSKRIQHDVVLMHIFTEQPGKIKIKKSFCDFTMNILKNFTDKQAMLINRMQRDRIGFFHLISQGSIAAAVSTIHHAVKGLEFTVVQGPAKWLQQAGMNLPVFVFDD